jgi:uncharacterized membrane protein YraQ (UPF0718 family)
MSLHPAFSSQVSASAKVFLSTFAGLAMDTLPFLLIGSFLAAVIAAFVPDRALRSLFPRNPWLSILAALGLGLFLPVCDCATVPLARRLREKGVRLSAAAAFLLAAPIVNPLSIASTIVAFAGAPFPVFAFRLGAGLAAAFAVAAAIELASRRTDDFGAVASALGAGPIDGGAPATRSPSIAERVLGALHLAADDFLDSSRYLVAGLVLASLARCLLPAGILAKSLDGSAGAFASGAISAYALSLCSSADAFVARSLFAPDSYLAALAFMVVGPMIDLKNTILLSRFVRPSRLAAFVVLVMAAAAFACSAAAALWGMGA